MKHIDISTKKTSYLVFVTYHTVGINFKFSRESKFQILMNCLVWDFWLSRPHVKYKRHSEQEFFLSRKRKSYLDNKISIDKLVLNLIYTQYFKIYFCLCLLIYFKLIFKILFIYYCNQVFNIIITKIFNADIRFIKNTIWSTENKWE